MRRRVGEEEVRIREVGNKQGEEWRREDMEGNREETEVKEGSNGGDEREKGANKMERRGK